jgi:hypothetical protein
MSRNPTTLVTHTQPRRSKDASRIAAPAPRRPPARPPATPPPGVSHLTSQHLSALSVSQPVKPPPPTGHSAPATGVWYSWDRRQQAAAGSSRPAALLLALDLDSKHSNSNSKQQAASPPGASAHCPAQCTRCTAAVLHAMSPCGAVLSNSNSQRPTVQVSNSKTCCCPRDQDLLFCFVICCFCSLLSPRLQVHVQLSKTLRDLCCFVLLN